MKKYYVWIAVAVLVVWISWFFGYKQYLKYQADSKGHGAWWDPSLEDLLDLAGEGWDKDAQISCLRDKGVTFYGGESCGTSCEDVKKYGSDMNNFECVDCDLDEASCKAMGVKDLPARWSKDGKIIQDITSLADLAVEYGCN